MTIKITDGKLTLIHKNNKPYAIRDCTGVLFLFAYISKYEGQEERYERELEEQSRLADFLLDALENQATEDLDDVNWEEDYQHENGNYINTCMDCGSAFRGHKRRLSCKVCATKEG